MRGVAAHTPVAETPQDYSSVLAAFSKHRRFNNSICRSLAMDSESTDLARAIGNCATSIGVEVQLPKGAAPEAKLRAARICNRRLCPFCEWRRAKGWRRRFFEGMPRFHEDFPTHKPLFLTLTQRNVHLGELRETIQDMHKAWNRMKQCSFFPTPFWFRRTEVTVNGSGMAHPHIHVLLMVPAGYFSRNYVKQSEWAAQWQMAGRYDYTPVVDIRRGRTKPGTKRLTDLASVQASVEVSKYITKATDLLALEGNLGEFNRQIRHLRFSAVSDSLKPYISAADISEEEMTDGGEALPVESVNGIAVWFEDCKQYLWSDIF